MKDKLKSSGFIDKKEKTLPAEVKPFLKWAGGKGQLLERFQGFYPEELKSGEIQKYYEPFVGGGAVFFDIASKFNLKTMHLYDINEELILTYQVVQKEVRKLIDYLFHYKKLYEGIGGAEQKEFFYALRKKFNEQRLKIDRNRFSELWIERAAQVIFLNKTCFNGLFRFNLKGDFNVPAGSYKNPKIVDEQNLLKASELLSVAEIRTADFKTMEKDVVPGSFVYFDPPYRPLNKTSSFTSYSKHGFSDTDQFELAALFKRLNKAGVKLMLSNSDPKNSDPNDNFFDDLYRDFSISRIPAKRMINSNGAKRNAVNEIVVTNYSV